MKNNTQTEKGLFLTSDDEVDKLVKDAVESEREFWQDRVKKLDKRIYELTKCEIKIKDEVFK